MAYGEHPDRTAVGELLGKMWEYGQATLSLAYSGHNNDPLTENERTGILEHVAVLRDLAQDILNRLAQPGEVAPCPERYTKTD